jgi:hypothetical protein
MITLDIRPLKAPPQPPPREGEERDEEGSTRGLMRPVKAAGHPSVEELEIFEFEEELDEFPAEKTIGQGAPIPKGLREEPSEEAIEGQETVQGKPLRRSGSVTPPAKSSGDFAAIFEDDNDGDDGDSTRPLIEMKQQKEAQLSWQERSKLIQEGQGGLADLFSAGKGKDPSKSREPSRNNILSPEYRKALDSSNVLGGSKEFVTTALRKYAELKSPIVPELRTSEEPKPPSSIAELRRSAELKHPEEAGVRPSPELKAMPSFRNSADFKVVGAQKYDSKPSLAVAAKSALEVPPPNEPPDPPKRRTQLVPKAPMFSPLEEVQGAIPKSEEAGATEPSVNAPLQPQQKFPTAPLVQVAKHKPIIEYLDPPSPKKKNKQPIKSNQNLRVRSFNFRRSHPLARQVMSHLCKRIHLAPALPGNHPRPTLSRPHPLSKPHRQCGKSRSLTPVA